MRPTTEQLEKAVEIRKQIDRLEKELAAILGGSAVATVPKAEKTEKPRRKRHLSPEARERIAAAQRERWKKQKTQQQSKSAPK